MGSSETIEEAGLYKRVLGSDWDRLASTIQLAHERKQATGKFTVTWGKGLIIRCLVQVMQLPAPGDQVPVVLEIESANSAEVWLRTFGRQKLITSQASGEPGVLLERMGILTFRLQLIVTPTQGLEYRTVGVRIGLVPLPLFLCPNIRANEETTAVLDQTHIHVTVSLPILGTMIEYAGLLDWG